MAMSAIEKLRKPQVPKIVNHLPDRVAHWGPPGASMVISTPAIIDESVGHIPKGKLTTMAKLREALARHHKTDITCPITTGIFLNIVAKAAAEMQDMGAKRVTPWWRVIQSDGKLNPKFPGGIEGHRKKLEVEGFKIEQRGKSALAVEDYEKRLAKL
jgi:hypothetical protein